jgi:hypothetical protein
MLAALRPLLLLPLLAAAAPAQEDPAAPLPEGVVATVDGEPIALADYQAYLYQRLGKRPLQGMIDHLLVTREAERFGVVADGAEIQARFDQRMEQARRGLNEADFAANLRQSGQDPAAFAASMREDVTQEILLDGLILATRVLTDEGLRRAFEERFGRDGRQVEVKQILVMPHFLRAERIRNGEAAANIDQEALRAEARDMAQECLTRLRAGEDWSPMVREYSHDQVTRNDDGLLPTYRPGLYGPAYTEAVDTLEIGEYSEVVSSGAGFHVVQVASRQITAFTDVREELGRLLLAAAPDWQEREQFLNALRGRAEIKRW